MAHKRFLLLLRLLPDQRNVGRYFTIASKSA
jgi:hypothetical protein